MQTNQIISVEIIDQLPKAKIKVRGEKANFPMKASDGRERIAKEARTIKRGKKVNCLILKSLINYVFVQNIMIKYHQIL